MPSTSGTFDWTLSLPRCWKGCGDVLLKDVDSNCFYDTQTADLGSEAKGAYWKGWIKLNEDKRVFAIISFFLAFTSILSTLPNEICLQSDKQNLAPTKRKENVPCVQFLNVRK
ncbi:hypothetical protein AB205_0081880, partial [Aquarana catesbeiana]